MDYKKDIYDKWDSFPTCSIAIPGESLWGRVLPDGTYGIDNDPLSDVYRWQDIVRSKTLSEEDAENLIVYRRWHTKFFFLYNDLEDEDESLALRQGISDVLREFGDPGFFWKGVGYILLEAKMTSKEAFILIKKPLAEAGIKIKRAR